MCPHWVQTRHRKGFQIELECYVEQVGPMQSKGKQVLLEERRNERKGKVNL
jgi:hypothetical protein